MSLFTLISLLIVSVSMLALQKVYAIKKTVGSEESKFLLSVSLICLSLNFIVALLVGDPTDAMIEMWRPKIDKYWFDMGATSIGWYLYELRSLHSGTDSWWYMGRAIEQIQNNPAASVYEELFFKQHIKFQYPTSSLILLDFFQWITRFSWEKTYETLNIISFTLIPIASYIFYRIYYRQHIDNPLFLNKKPIAFSLSIVFVMLFYPLIFSLYLGQIQSFILVLVSFAYIFFIKDKKWAAGLLLGICASIKPQWIIIILWALLRKEKQLLWGATISAAIFFILSIELYGLHNLLEYQTVLAYLSQHGESYYLNQSINGLVNRLLMNGINTEFKFDSIPPYHATVYFSTLVSSVILILFALLWRVREKPTIVDLSIVILCLTIASPVAWNHHYVVLLPIFASIIPSIINNPSKKSSVGLLLITVCITTQNFEGLTNQLSESAWNILQSSLFFGGLLTLAFLIKLSVRGQHDVNIFNNNMLTKKS